MYESNKIIRKENMKKKILKAAFVAAFAMIAGYSVYNSQKDVALSDVALANVEALARGEGSGIPYQGAYPNWDKGGCCESGRWNDECRSSSFCR